MKNGKRSMAFLLPLGIIITSMLLFVADSFAQTQGTNWRNRLEIGSGAIKTDLVEMLVKIEANSTITPNGEGGNYYVLVRFKGDAAMNFETSPAFVDISANFLGFGYDTGPNSVLRGFGDITFLNLNYGRNLSINESYHYNLSLVGLRGG